MRSRANLCPAEPKIEAFLTDLAVHGNVAASTQNQAMHALVFLYKRVLKQELSERIDVVRAPTKRNMPVVMTREEVPPQASQVHSRAMCVSQSHSPSGDSPASRPQGCQGVLHKLVPRERCAIGGLREVGKAECVAQQVEHHGMHSVRRFVVGAHGLRPPYQAAWRAHGPSATARQWRCTGPAASSALRGMRGLDGRRQAASLADRRVRDRPRRPLV